MHLVPFSSLLHRPGSSPVSPYVSRVIKNSASGSWKVKMGSNDTVVACMVHGPEDTLVEWTFEEFDYNTGRPGQEVALENGSSFR